MLTLQKLCNIMCTLVATGVILWSLECTSLSRFIFLCINYIFLAFKGSPFKCRVVMDVVPLFAWKASQHAFFILRHHLFKHAKWPQVDIKIKVCMRKQTMALPKILRRLEEFRLRRHVPTISRILESGHAKPRNLRKKKKKFPFLCVYRLVFSSTKLLLLGWSTTPF